MHVVRELSKCMDKTTMGTYLEMLRVIKFVIDIKHFCLRIQPEIKFKNWSLHVFIGLHHQFSLVLGLVKLIRN
jgi:hypothetical protein